MARVRLVHEGNRVVTDEGMYVRDRWANVTIDGDVEVYGIHLTNSLEEGWQVDEVRIIPNSTIPSIASFRMQREADASTTIKVIAAVMEAGLMAGGRRGV